MAGKVITLFPSYVEKRNLLGGSVERQYKNLRDAESLGFSIAPILSFQNGCLQQIRLFGLNLKECLEQSLSEEQKRDLQQIQELERKLKVYVGDLNCQNLIWEEDSWIIIDCGSTRFLSSGKLEEKLLYQREWKWKGVL